MSDFAVTNTPIPDVLIIEPVTTDREAFCTETYNMQKLYTKGLRVRFVQENQSGSVRGVLRGIHWQQIHPQGKLIRIIQGVVFDVAVDVRKNSKTFGQWYGIELSAENNKQLYVGEGIAHGFLALSDKVEFCYKVTEYYHPEEEIGIAWNDPNIGIQWPGLSKKDSGSYAFDDGTTIVLAERDKHWGTLKETISRHEIE